MDFKTRRISRRLRRTRRKTKGLPSFLFGLVLLGVIVFVGYHVVRFVVVASFTKIVSIVSTVAGDDLKKDDQGHINILALGVPGEGHEGATLTDTMIIISISPEKKIVSMVSIPRDLYGETEGVGASRVNEIYEYAKRKYGNEEGLKIVAKSISDMTSIPLPYYIKIDFRGFEQAIDRIGGVTVYLPEPLNDPLYPKDGTFGYEPLSIPAGIQHLNGKMALKYARSRQTSSDFDRSKRQRELLIALKDQVLARGILSSPSRLKSLYEDLSHNVETNFSLRELLTFADVILEMKETKPSMATIHDDPAFPGGFLYTPLRELYQGAFVLRPASDHFDEVRRFFRLSLYAPDILAQKTNIRVLNGTNQGGIAIKVKQILNRYGFTVGRFGNARLSSVEKTTYYYQGEKPPEVIALLQELIPGSVTSPLPSEYLSDGGQDPGDVILELGKDSLPAIRKLDIFRNVVPLKPAIPGTTTPGTTQGTST